MKILFFMGSRSNYGRLKVLYDAVKRTNEVSLIGSCTFNQIDTNLKTDLYINADLYNDSIGKETVTQGIIAVTVSSWLNGKTFDFAICHGDRFETLGFAQAIAYSGIQLVHLEAGELSKVDNKTRWAISALADIHLCHSQKSYNRLVELNKAGLSYKPYFVGNPVVDYIESIKFKGELKNQVVIGYNPVSVEEFKLFQLEIEKILNKNPDIKFIWVNPNIDLGFQKVVDVVRNKLVRKFDNLEFVKNLVPIEYLRLLHSSFLLIGNASSGIKESYIMGLPYIMYGSRQTSREVFKNVSFSSTNLAELVQDNLNYYKYNGHYRFSYDGELGKGVVKKIQEVLKENKK